MRKTTPVLLTLTLVLTLALLHVTGAGRVLMNALRHSPTATPRSFAPLDVAAAQSLHVEDDREGSVQFSPVTVHANLLADKKLWYGSVTLSVHSDKRVNGYWQSGTAEKNLGCAVPAYVMQRVFQQIARAPLLPDTVSPNDNGVDDHAVMTMEFQAPTGTTSLHTEARTWDGAPWHVGTMDGNALTRSSAPYEALRLLRPYLHEEELPALKTQAAAPQ